MNSPIDILNNNNIEQRIEAVQQITVPLVFLTTYCIPIEMDMNYEHCQLY